MNCLSLNPESSIHALTPTMACEQWQGAKHSIEELENRLFFPHSTNSYKNEIGKRGKRQKLNLSLAATHY